MRLTEEEYDYLKEQTKKSHLRSVASYIRTKALEDFSPCITQIPTEMELYRSERRSLFISNKLWYEVLDICYKRSSISEFIVQAIKEKIDRLRSK